MTRPTNLRGRRTSAGRHLAGVAAVALLAGASLPAAAQDAAAPDKPASSQPAASGNSGSMETIMVSARKTEERAIDTPVALAAMSEAQIQRYNTTDLTQLSSQLPGVVINKSSGGGAGGNMTIRGIGNIATDYGAEQPVALVIDGFSFTRGHIIDVGFFDVESIQVLKGPQTLFFGKNSPAGVISVKSVSPGDYFEGYVRASYEFRSEDPTLEFGVSVPVNDKFKFRVAGRGEFMQGGYIKNTAADVNRNISPFETDALYPSNPNQYKKYPHTKQFVGRFTGVFTPNDNFDATLKVFGADTRDNDAGNAGLYACADGVGGHPYLSTGFFGLVADPTQTCTGKIQWKRNSALPPQAIIDANPTLDSNDTHYFNHNRNLLTTLEMNWKIGDVTLTSVSGYWDYKQREFTQYDYTSYGVVNSKQGESGHSFTQELRLRTDYDTPVNFMIGGFYEKSYRTLTAPVQIFPLGPAPDSTYYPDYYNGSFLTYDQYWQNWIESWSIFAEMRWNITDTLELSGGVRYTEDDRHSTGTQLFNRLDDFFAQLGYPPSANPFAHTGTQYHLNRSFHNTSPQVTLSWKPTTDLMIYAAYKTGFQAAGISNPGTIGNFGPEVNVNDTLTFDGSTVKGFEIGVKGSFLNGRLTGDADVYRYRYNSLQVAVFDPITTNFTVQNAAAAINKGIEANLYFQATDALQLRLAAQYNHLQFANFHDAQCYAGQNDPSAATYRADLAPLCHLSDSGAGYVQDMSGETYGGPPLQVNAGFTYDTPISDQWNLVVSGDVIHFNKGRETLREPGTAIPARTLINASVRLRQDNGPWEVALICTNCGNDHYVYSIQDKPLGKTGDLDAYLGTPRLITLQTTYRW
ncbi:MAG: TonB-dependent receptor plug domain-containing protein [Alphaproteobacteria bacterium]|nr:TonB-dependent receptor plug domain-containing protein [Alphaproteobacteria bacterium]